MLSSCKEDRLISSYVVRNKIVEHHKERGDTVIFPEINHWYDKKNKSYLEIAKYNYNGTKGLLFSSDLFNKYSPSDKYEKVNYTIVDSIQIAKIIQFYDGISKPTKTKKPGTIIDYSVNKDFFITYIIENTPLSENLMYPKVKCMSLWIHGRRHDLNHVRFIRELKRHN